MQAQLVRYTDVDYLTALGQRVINTSSSSDSRGKDFTTADCSYVC